MEDISTDQSDIENAYKKLHNATFWSLYIAIFSVVVYFVTTSMLKALLFKRKQFCILPLKVKITFFVNFIVTLYTTVLCIWLGV